MFEGRVFVPYSGHYGDCGDYHGVVVGVSQSDPTKVESFSTRARGGGIWGQGGVTGDGKSLFAATGNTFGASAWSDGEAVLRFGPSLARPASPPRLFRPVKLEAARSRRSGPRRNGADSARRPDRQRRPRKLIFAIGKTGDAYLLDRDNLGGIGPALLSAHVSWRTGPWPRRRFGARATACSSRSQGYGANCPPIRRGRDLWRSRFASIPRLAIETAWCAAVPGNRGSPIVTTTDGHSNPIVFIVGAEADNRLYAFRGDTGELIASPPGASARLSPISDAHRRR